MNADWNQNLICVDRRSSAAEIGFFSFLLNGESLHRRRKFRGGEWGRNGQATATPLAEASSAAGLFLLPGGLPRRLGEASDDIQAGGLPRRGPRPAARRSRVRMACSSCSFSSFNSARILATSIMETSPGRPNTGDGWPTSDGIHIKCVPSIQLYFPPGASEISRPRCEIKC